MEKSPLIRFFDELDFKQIPVSVKRKKKEECPSGLILIDSNCDKALGVTTESVAVRTVYEQLLTKICRTRVKVFLQAMKERDLQKQKKVADVELKDVRAQNVPTYRFFLHLPRRKVMIYFFQKGKKNGGSPCSFSRS